VPTLLRDSGLFAPKYALKLTTAHSYLNYRINVRLTVGLFGADDLHRTKIVTCGSEIL
jgi:hypothetical protein